MSPNDDPLQIRPATENDLPSILMLLEQLTDAMVMPITAIPERVLMHVRHFMRDGNHGVFLAERSGQVVGLISVNVRWTLLQANPVALVDELVVSDAARGQGVGRRLIDEAIRFARSRGCEELEVGTEQGNTAAQDFYRECGFKEEHVLLEMELIPEPNGETGRGKD